MGNDVAVAKQDAVPNFCDGSLDDIELCEKGVHQVWTVDEDGDAQEMVETYSMEAYYAYYDCSVCGETFDIEELGHKLAWKAVKEHFNEES